MNDFGNFLYELRKEKGMTQTELAGKLGVTNKAVSKWETGEAMPETGLLMPLSEIFGVSIDELLSGKRERTRGARRQRLHGLRLRNYYAVVHNSLYAYRSFHGTVAPVLADCSNRFARLRSYRRGRRSLCARKKQSR